LDRDPRARVTNREAVEKLRDQWAGYDNHGLREAVAVARGAIAYSRIEKFDAAICGHTHGPFCGTLGGFPYANCGSWTKGNPATYVVVDNGWMGLVEYKSG
jgi:UDP-2,3-diacylglucosamine pyrophosphatase LpxH